MVQRVVHEVTTVVQTGKEKTMYIIIKEFILKLRIQWYL